MSTLTQPDLLLSKSIDLIASTMNAIETVDRVYREINCLLIAIAIALANYMVVPSLGSRGFKSRCSTT